MRILIVGYGKMGKLVESLAGEYKCEVAGIVDPLVGPDGVDSPRWAGVDVAIDFSSPDAVVTNIPVLAGRGINMVVGTTGWGRQEASLRQAVASAGVGIVAAPNFSTGVVFFDAVVAQAAKYFAGQAEFGAFLHEAHHAAKKDAPSGTAITLEASMVGAGYRHRIDMASSRAGSVPGVHTIGFDGPFETITMTHSNRDRAAFAQGALQAAKWVHGKHGWFTIRDVLGL